MTLRKIGNNYYSYFRDEYGKQRTVATKTSDRKEAEAFDNTMMESVRAKRQHMQILKYADPELREKLIRQNAEQKIRRELENGKDHKRGTIRLDAMLDIASKRKKLSCAHKFAWGKFLRWTANKYSFADEILPRIALEYLETNFSSGHEKTYNNNKSCLNTIFRCCLIEAGMSVSPFSSIVNKTVKHVASHRNLTLEEVDLILANANDLTKVLVMLSRWTAQRLETCARISESMLNFERGVFIIDPGKTKRFNKWVCCPLFKPLRDFLQTPEIHSKFPKDKTRPIVEGFGWRNGNAFSTSFARLLESLHICSDERGTACFHSLRGTAITYFKEHGIIGEELRMITGHESKAVEDIYARDIATISRISQGFECM